MHLLVHGQHLHDVLESHVAVELTRVGEPFGREDELRTPGEMRQESEPPLRGHFEKGGHGLREKPCRDLGVLDEEVATGVGNQPGDGDVAVLAFGRPVRFAEEAHEQLEVAGAECVGERFHLTLEGESGLSVDLADGLDGNCGRFVARYGGVGRAALGRAVLGESSERVPCGSGFDVVAELSEEAVDAVGVVLRVDVGRVGLHDGHFDPLVFDLCFATLAGVKLRIVQGRRLENLPRHIITKMQISQRMICVY